MHLLQEPVHGLAIPGVMGSDVAELAEALAPGPGDLGRRHALRDKWYMLHAHCSVGVVLQEGPYAVTIALGHRPDHVSQAIVVQLTVLHGAISAISDVLLRGAHVVYVIGEHDHSACMRLEISKASAERACRHSGTAAAARCQTSVRTRPRAFRVNSGMVGYPHFQYLRGAAPGPASRAARPEPVVARERPGLPR